NQPVQAFVLTLGPLDHVLARVPHVVERTAASERQVAFRVEPWISGLENRARFVHISCRWRKRVHEIPRPIWRSKCDGVRSMGIAVARLMHSHLSLGRARR